MTPTSYKKNLWKISGSEIIKKLFYEGIKLFKTKLTYDSQCEYNCYLQIITKTMFNIYLKKKKKPTKCRK